MRGTTTLPPLMPAAPWCVCATQASLAQSAFAKLAPAAWTRPGASGQTEPTQLATLASQRSALAAAGVTLGEVSATVRRASQVVLATPGLPSHESSPAAPMHRHNPHGAWDHARSHLPGPLLCYQRAPQHCTVFYPADTLLVTMRTFLACLAAAAVAAASAEWAPPLYRQCDPRWGSNEMGTTGKGERSTICLEGCAMSSVSSALAGLGVQLDGEWQVQCSSSSSPATRVSTAPVGPGSNTA